MATDYIGLDESKRHSQALRQLVNYQTESLERLRSCKAVLDEMIDGSDYSEIETELGLSAGEGEIVYNLIAGALAVVDVYAVQTVIARLG